MHTHWAMPPNRFECQRILSRSGALGRGVPGPRVAERHRPRKTIEIGINMTQFSITPRHDGGNNASASKGGTTMLRRRLKWIGLVSLIPVVVLVVFVSIVGYRETIASGELKARIDELRRDGEPFDNDSMAEYFEKNAHKEGTAAWSEILTLTQAANAISDNLPLVGAGTLPSDLSPGSDWPDEARVTEFLHEVRPLIQRISKADEFPKPVWMPIRFNGFSTLLEEAQTSRSIARIVELDAIHALYHKDGNRALQAIRSLNTVAEAFDWDFCMVAKLVSLAIRATHRNAIDRSLDTGVWNEEQLDALSDQVKKPYDVAKTWKATIAGERGFAYPILDNPRILQDVHNSPFNPLLYLPVTPSTRLAVLRAYEDLEHCADAGNAGIAARAKETEARFFENRSLSLSYSFLAMMLPAISAYSEAFDREEIGRRLAYTAIAVKRFQMKNQRWPKSLSELSGIGLVATHWTTSDGQSFGYEVEDGRAYLWSYGFSDKKIVPKTRPSLEPDAVDRGFPHLVSVR